MVSKLRLYKPEKKSGKKKVYLDWYEPSDDSDYVDLVLLALVDEYGADVSLEPHVLGINDKGEISLYPFTVPNDYENPFSQTEEGRVQLSPYTKSYLGITD